MPTVILRAAEIIARNINHLRLDAAVYDGWRHIGCPIGALANPVVTDPRREVRCKARPWSTVIRLGPTLRQAMGLQSQ
jgi:hypothetical protein